MKEVLTAIAWVFTVIAISLGMVNGIYQSKANLHEEDHPVITEHDEPVVIADRVTHPWTSKDLNKLARLIYCEAGIVDDTAQQAAVVWCVLNRLDDGRWGDTIEEVVTAPDQFAYDPVAPLKIKYVQLAEDVLTRWEAEKNGWESVGRTLPRRYLYFGSENGVNYFRTEYETWDDVWDWSLPDPYQE